MSVWIEGLGRSMEAGTKCGVLMGDYSRCGINTMLNTGTVIGVSCNVFGGHFPAKFVPSFSWGDDGVYRLPEALKDAGKWMALKGHTLTAKDSSVLEAVYELIYQKDLKT